MWIYLVTTVVQWLWICAVQFAVCVLLPIEHCSKDSITKPGICRFSSAFCYKVHQTVVTRGQTSWTSGSTTLHTCHMYTVETSHHQVGHNTTFTRWPDHGVIFTRLVTVHCGVHQTLYTSRQCVLTLDWVLSSHIQGLGSHTTHTVLLFVTLSDINYTSYSSQVA